MWMGKWFRKQEAGNGCAQRFPGPLFFEFSSAGGGGDTETLPSAKIEPDNGGGELGNRWMGIYLLRIVVVTGELLCLPLLRFLCCATLELRRGRKGR